MRLIVKAILRFGVGATFLLGGPELVLHSMASTSALTNTHYQFSSSDNLVAIYEPVAGCQLPPCQPFAMMLGMNALKVLVMGICFGTVPSLSTERIPRWSWLLSVALIIYQYVAIPLTMLSTISHFINNSGPF